MDMNLIIGALTFKREVYAQVENDSSFTQTAWVIVAAVSFLASLSWLGQADGIVGGIIGVIFGTVVAVLGFAVGAWAISWAGQTLFQADVNFEEMVRTLGLAYVWRVVAALGILGFVPALGCLLAPVQFIAWILWVVSWVIAAKEALDLEWAQTAISVAVGFVIALVLNLVFGAIMGVIGLAGGAAAGALGG